MKRSFRDAIEHRRSYYSISSRSPISDDEIEDILKFAVKNVPSAFNSQTTRVVLLLGEKHRRLWEITTNILKEMIPPASFAPTQVKMDSFAAGYGTVLYFEDLSIVTDLQAKFPLYSDNFPVWSEHTSAMHQIVIWTMLEDAGFGASLQHYNPLIDSDVKKELGLSDTWKLVAQMPFGIPTAEPASKSFEPLDKRVLIFK